MVWLGLGAWWQSEKPDFSRYHTPYRVERIWITRDCTDVFRLYTHLDAQCGQYYVAAVMVMIMMIIVALAQKRICNRSLYIPNVFQVATNHRCPR